MAALPRRRGRANGNTSPRWYPGYVSAVIADQVLERCDDCGQTFLRAKGRRKHRCFDCARRRMTRAAIESKAREGGTYETIVRKQLAHWTAEARRLGLTPDG